MNESDNIKQLIDRLQKASCKIEIIVADGGSKDSTLQLAKNSGAKTIAVAKACRAKQMNAGAKHAKAELLYFVHADALPPRDYDEQLLQAIGSGANFGSFRFKFDENKGMLKINSYCTRFKFMMFRGGDQTLFIKRNLFEKVGGYDETMPIMEDYDIITRAKGWSPFTLIQDDVIVSARKYFENSYLRVNCANFIVFSLYYCGVSTTKLSKLYPRLIHHPNFE